jgi:ABC-type enterobactin transport system permease subunit
MDFLSNLEEMIMMNALIVATLCSVILGSVPAAATVYVLARRNGERNRRRTR